MHPFSDEPGIATDVPIVDGAMAHDCPFSGESCMLLVQNTLYILSMEMNLILPIYHEDGRNDC